METFIGSIMYFPFGWGSAPRGWAECKGQLMSIAQNTALFSLIGTQFGGDGVQTFALPNIAPMKSANGHDIRAFISLEGIYPSRD